MWVGIVWAWILIFVWLWGKIRVQEWCGEVVGSCKVEQVPRCSFLLLHNLINLYACTCVHLCVCVDAVCAMKALNSKGIVHRDLKPGNILLSHSGKPNPAPTEITLKIGKHINADNSVVGVLPVFFFFCRSLAFPWFYKMIFVIVIIVIITYMWVSATSK